METFNAAADVSNDPSAHRHHWLSPRILCWRQVCRSLERVAQFRCCCCGYGLKCAVWIPSGRPGISHNPWGSLVSPLSRQHSDVKYRKCQHGATDCEYCSYGSFVTSVPARTQTRLIPQPFFAMKHTSHSIHSCNSFKMHKNYKIQSDNVICAPLIVSFFVYR